MGFVNKFAASKKSFQPLEEGYYEVRIKGFAQKEFKTSKGTYIEADLEVVNGGAQGRRLWHKFMTGHSTPRVKSIGIQQLDSLLKAIGMDDGSAGISDSSQLSEFVGETLKVKVGIQESETFGRQNKVTSFYGLKRAA